MADIETFPDTFTDQVMAYKDMREEMESAYPGRWVIIHDLQCVGDYGSFREAEAGAMESGLDLLDCYIKQVGVLPPIIISYGR